MRQRGNKYTINPLKNASKLGSRGFRLKRGYYDSLKLAVHEKVAAYVLFLILRVGMR